VTGGASFIGSHLVDALIERGAQVRVVDNLSRGRLENLHRHLETGRVEFIQDDLLNPGVADRTAQGMEYVFHLAADRGGACHQFGAGRHRVWRNPQSGCLQSDSCLVRLCVS
jgi:nucleoside-diphosphate-sugar epimerase